MNGDTNFDLLADGNLTIAGTLMASSSESLKENLVPLDPQSILSDIGDLSISEWNYITEDSGVRHIGPMAEAFYSLFGLATVGNSTPCADARLAR